MSCEVDIGFADCEFDSGLIGASSTVNYEKTAKTLLDGLFKTLKVLQKNKIARDLITKIMEAFEKIFKDGDVVNGIIDFIKKTFTKEEIQKILDPKEMKDKLGAMFKNKSGDLDPEAVGAGAELAVGAYLRIVKTGVSGVLLALGPATGGISDAAMIFLRVLMDFVIVAFPKILKNIVPIIVKVLNQLKKEFLKLFGTLPKKGTVVTVPPAQDETKQPELFKKETPEETAHRVALEFAQEGRKALEKDILPEEKKENISPEEKSKFIQSIILNKVKRQKYLYLDNPEDQGKLSKLVKKLKGIIIRGCKGVLKKNHIPIPDGDDFAKNVDAYLEFVGDDNFEEVYLTRLPQFESMKEGKLSYGVYKDLEDIVNGSGFEFDKLLGDVFVLKHCFP